jgi:hypothetical protein
VRDARPGVPERADFPLVHVDAVRREHLRLEQPLLLDPGDDRHPVGLPGLLRLEERLRQVRVQRHVVLRGELRAGAQDLRRAGVRRVRGRPGQDERMPLPPLDERRGAGEKRRTVCPQNARMPAPAAASATASSK